MSALCKNDMDWIDNEAPEGFKPRFGSKVSCVDPDSGEEVGGPGLIPTTAISQEMLAAVRGHSMKFKTAQEATAWYRLESHPMFGCSQEEWYRWLQSRFWCARQYHWSYQTLVRACKSEDRFRPWLGRYKNE